MEKNFTHFFSQHEGRIRYQIHRIGITGEWYEEFYQEGLIGLWNAYKNYDNSRGEIGTYLNYKIRFCLMDLLRRKLKTKEKADQALEQMIAVISDGNIHKGTEKQLIQFTDISIKENETFWKEVRSHLTEKQWKWVKYFIIAELSVKEIMELENVSADTIKNWGRLAKNNLKKPEAMKKLERLLQE